MNEAVETALANPAPRTLNIRFTGSGSEYFRIWIVNLLLIVVTLGLYFPFAKARRIRYFHANTQVDGQALGFHGDPWKMFRGFLLLLALMGSYAVAGRFSPLAALVAFLALCAVWPALWRASMQFRLRNTSWRGLRMSFDGSLRAAYLAVAPLYVPLIAFVGLSLFVEQEPGSAALVATALLLVAMAVVTLAVPWFLARSKRYQHDGYRIARQRARLELSTGRMYKLCLKAVAVAFVPTFLAGVVAAIVAGAMLAAAGAAPAEATSGRAVLGPLFGVLLAYFFWFVVIAPYFAARLQDLVWNATRSEAVSFTSRLRFRSLFWLTLKNWTLVALTLGFYRPFAAVHTARLRLEAVALNVTEDPALWTAPAPAGAHDATGEVAGDFFGIDMGL